MPRQYGSGTYYSPTAYDNVGEFLNAFLPSFQRAMLAMKEQKRDDEATRLQFAQLDPEVQDRLRVTLPLKMQQKLGLVEHVKGVDVETGKKKDYYLHRPTRPMTAEEENRKRAVAAQVKTSEAEAARQPMVTEGVRLQNVNAEMQNQIAALTLQIQQARTPLEVQKAQRSLQALQGPLSIETFTLGMDKSFDEAVKMYSAAKWPQIADREALIALDPSNPEAVNRRRTALFTELHKSYDLDVALKLADATAKNDYKALEALAKKDPKAALAWKQYGLQVQEQVDRRNSITQAKNNLIAQLTLGLTDDTRRVDVESARGIATALVEGKPIEGMDKAALDQANAALQVLASGEAQRKIRETGRQELDSLRQIVGEYGTQIRQGTATRQTRKDAEKFQALLTQKTAEFYGYKPEEVPPGGVMWNFFSKIGSWAAGVSDLTVEAAKDEIAAETQFQDAVLMDVLGPEGFALIQGIQGAAWETNPVVAGGKAVAALDRQSNKMTAKGLQDIQALPEQARKVDDMLAEAVKNVPGFRMFYVEKVRTKSRSLIEELGNTASLERREQIRKELEILETTLQKMGFR